MPCELELKEPGFFYDSTAEVVDNQRFTFCRGGIADDKDVWQIAADEAGDEISRAIITRVVCDGEGPSPACEVGA